MPKSAQVKLWFSSKVLVLVSNCETFGTMKLWRSYICNFAFLPKTNQLLIRTDGTWEKAPGPVLVSLPPSRRGRYRTLYLEMWKACRYILQKEAFQTFHPTNHQPEVGGTDDLSWGQPRNDRKTKLATSPLHKAFIVASCSHESTNMA